MLNWLKEIVGKARAGMTTEIAKFKNRDFMEADVTGCAIVAAADGSIDSSEKQKMVKFHEQFGQTQALRPQGGRRRLQQGRRRLEFRRGDRKANALMTISKVKDKEGQTRPPSRQGRLRHRRGRWDLLPTGVVLGARDRARTWLESDELRSLIQRHPPLLAGSHALRNQTG